MTTNNYIAAIEIGSSKISGAIGIQTYSGTKIMAYASEPVNGFIAKGVVRNVDETGNCLTSLINRLETQMNNITVEKAYIAFGGLSMHSIKSTVTRDFDEYTKITQATIDEMALENDAVFTVPEGYQKVQVVALEYKLNGDKNIMPIGVPTKHIECNYLNIIVREQYMRQLQDSFNMANIKITDSFNAARIDAETILSEEETINGTALVNIGAETTTIAIYTNKLLRKLNVIPLGSSNITKDLCAEQMSPAEAEQIKIFKGYNPEADDNGDKQGQTVNMIISARMAEILQNVKYQIETSGENVGNIVFTGGGSNLKGICNIIDDNIPNFKIRIATDCKFCIDSDENLELTTGAITPTLYGLLSRGKENCCKEETVVEQSAEPQQAQVPTNLFGEPEPETKTEKPKPAKSKETKTNEQKNKSGFLNNFFSGLRRAGEEFVGTVMEEEEPEIRDLFDNEDK